MISIKILKPNLILPTIQKNTKVRVKKKVIGMMKDETAGNEVTEFVGLRAKLYAYETDNQQTNTRCKGVKESFAVLKPTSVLSIFFLNIQPAQH